MIARTQLFGDAAVQMSTLQVQIKIQIQVKRQIQIQFILIADAIAQLFADTVDHMSWSHLQVHL